MQGPSGITRLLRAWGGGDEAALEQLTPLVYDQLRHWPAVTWDGNTLAMRSAH